MKELITVVCGLSLLFSGPGLARSRALGVSGDVGLGGLAGRATSTVQSAWRSRRDGSR